MYCCPPPLEAEVSAALLAELQAVDVALPVAMCSFPILDWLSVWVADAVSLQAEDEAEDEAADEDQDEEEDEADADGRVALNPTWGTHWFFLFLTRLLVF